jgi:hypothetical protein
MEYVSSLPYLQEPSTCPYPEPDQSSLYHPILPLVRLILILYIYVPFVFLLSLFPSDFPTKSYTCSSFPIKTVTCISD